MSRLFEALQKTENALPEADAEVLTGVLAGDGVLAADDVAAKQTRPEQSAASVPSLRTPEVEASVNLGFRTVPVRIQAASPVLPFDGVSSKYIEQYRIIRTKIGNHPLKPVTIAITSACSGDGKTINSINLAAALSLKAGTTVLLVDGDLRRSNVANLLGIEESPGLTDVLSGTASLQSAIVRLEQFPNCFVLPAGTPKANPPELLDSNQWHALAESLRQTFAHVIIDTPPIDTVTDYDLIETVSDGVVVIARMEHTNRAAIKKALQRIPASKLLGVVVNNVAEWFLFKVHGKYHYDYYEDYQASSGRSAK